ncbi:LysR family transcriptional regulator [Nocardiopsis sp. YSL2]|uniref:LysR family transcriptional regulator n=1 Tax=Nocardiopsis sp. YSL2 TaxID=2939492 RepID=UPI0026F44AD7|nr:LysR family transcriptional regulator [Nocardiopsis sp. YSL2]
MDLVGACRAFVYVSDRGSFTLGAAAARIPQPVASRRVAALEKHLGARLFDRTSRRATLTRFGRDMLPSARRLVDLAESMEHDAHRARQAPFGLAVPDVCPTRGLALLAAEGRRRGLRLDPRPGPPGERVHLLRSREVRAAVLAVPPGEATWTVPLGVAGAVEPAVAVAYVETLRVGRTDPPVGARRVWIQPEDDVPHIRDPLTRIRDAVGLRPGQVAVAASLASAAAEVLASADLLLCSRGQAEELGLHWRPLGEIGLARGYDVSADDAGDAEPLRGALHEPLGHCLGTPQTMEEVR